MRYTILILLLFQSLFVLSQKFNTKKTIFIKFEYDDLKIAEYCNEQTYLVIFSNNRIDTVKLDNSNQITINYSKSIFKISIINPCLQQRFYNEYYWSNFKNEDTISIPVSSIRIDYFPLFTFSKNSLNYSSFHDTLSLNHLKYLIEDKAFKKIRLHSFSWRENKKWALLRAEKIMSIIKEWKIDDNKVEIITYSEIPHECYAVNEYFLQGTVLSSEYINRQIYTKKMKKIAESYNRRIEIQLIW